MSPRNNNQGPKDKPDVTVDIPHERYQKPPAPATAPPLPEPEPLPIRPINITDNVPAPQPAPPVETPVVPPVLLHEFHEQEGRRWPVILVYTLLAFLVAVAVVFAGRWVYRKATHQTTKTTSTNQGSVPVAPTANTPANNPPSGASSNQTPTSTNGQLPNNGPGDVIAIFIGTALAVGGLHYLYGLRKQNSKF